MLKKKILTVSSRRTPFAIRLADGIDRRCWRATFFVHVIVACLAVMSSAAVAGTYTFTLIVVPPSSFTAAGGIISKHDGAPYHPLSGDVLASNGHIHAAMVAVLQAAQAT